MKKLKKVIAGVAAVAALVAVPTATAVAETVSDSTETNSATYNSSNTTYMLTNMTVSGIYVELDGTSGEVESNMCPENRDFENVSADLPDGYQLKFVEQTGDTSDDTVVVKYALQTESSLTGAWTTVAYYTVTFNFVDQQSCGTDEDESFKATDLTNMTVSGIYVELDGTSGEVESNMCPENRDFENVSADLPDGYQLKLVEQTGDTSDDTVVVKYALQTESSLTGAWSTMAYFTVTFNFVDQETCSTDTGEGDSGEDDNTGDDTTGDDDNTGDDTTDGDDTVDEDDTTDGTENPSDDESDTDDTDDTEATSDEESESDDTSTLATTGSALLGIGVFALVALIGAGVVYTVRKRA